VIDTSTAIEFLALSVDGKIYQYGKDQGMSHSVTMFQNLSSLLSNASIGMNDIHLIGTGIGPGSFTGIRIAVSTARMFAQMLKIPLVGLISPEIFAASACLTGNKTVLAAFDAKKSKIFGGVYRVTDSITDEIVKPGDYHIEDLLGMIKNPGELTCAGDGCGKYIDIIDRTSKKNGFSYNYLENLIPDGKAAADLTLRKYYQSPEIFTDYSNTVPLYSRKSDAEIAKYSG